MNILNKTKDILRNRFIEKKDKCILSVLDNIDKINLVFDSTILDRISIPGVQFIYPRDSFDTHGVKLVLGDEFYILKTDDKIKNELKLIIEKVQSVSNDAYSKCDTLIKLRNESIVFKDNADVLALSKTEQEFSKIIKEVRKQINILKVFKNRALILTNNKSHESKKGLFNTLTR